MSKQNENRRPTGQSEAPETQSEHTDCALAEPGRQAGSLAELKEGLLDLMLEDISVHYDLFFEEDDVPDSLTERMVGMPKTMTAILDCWRERKVAQIDERVGDLKCQLKEAEQLRAEERERLRAGPRPAVTM